MTDTNALCDVLLVEDEETDVLVFERALAKQTSSMKCRVARDGREALKMLRSSKQSMGSPCVVVTDLKMPEFSGLELIEAMRADERLCKLSIFVLSGSDLEEDISRAYSHNVAGYVTKDIEGVNVNKLVDLLKKYFETVQLPPQNANNY
jgi:CheY-like chemotaxis protein